MTCGCAAGAMAGRSDVLAAVRSMHNVLGGTLDPHAAYLLLRGLKTLDLRVSRQNSSAFEVSRRLERHPKVSPHFSSSFLWFDCWKPKQKPSSGVIQVVVHPFFEGGGGGGGGVCVCARVCVYIHANMDLLVDSIDLCLDMVPPQAGTYLFLM